MARADAALGGNARGVSDGREALAQANALGVPASLPIFFAVDFDASAAPALIGQFESAIGLLTPDGGTDIGQALTAAQNLLVKFGQPGNERLIVLLSDGADLPQREQGEGEITYLTMGPEAFAKFYQFSSLPAHTLPSDVVIIIVFSVLASTIAGLIPAWRAAKLQPVEALRSE